MTRADLALAVERHATSKLARGRPAGDRDARLSRRGAAVDRLGRAAHDHDAPRQRAACLGASTVDAGAKSEVKPAALDRRHARRGARSVLRDAGAAEIPEDRPHRSRGDPRRGAPARDEPAGCRLHARGRGARAGHLGRGAAGRGRTACAARRCARRGFPRQCGRRCAAGARALRIEGYAALPTYTRGNALGAISVRQRPSGARQAAARRGARRLCGLSAARPPSGGGAVRHASIRARST